MLGALLLALAAFSVAAPPNPPVMPCAPIGKLPQGCPQTIGGDCPRCYTNPYPDFAPGSPTEMSQAARAAMEAYLPEYLELMVGTHPPADYTDGGGVFEGTGGRALIHLKLFAKTGNATHLKVAKEYIDTSVAHLGEMKAADDASGMVGFFLSHTGVLSVATVVYHKLGDDATAASFAARVGEYVRARNSTFNDFDAGHAGLLFCTRFIAANVDASFTLPWSPEDVVALAHTIVDQGVTSEVPFLTWKSAEGGRGFLGTSHGSAGVLHELVEVAPLFENATAKGLVAATLDHIVSQQFLGGNFPTEFYNATQDVLVQWDHGAPGVSATLFRAATVLGDSRYATSAAKAQDAVWARGLLTKGSQLCHGLSGNVMTTLIAYQETGNSTYLYRAFRFVDFMMTHPTLVEPSLMRVVTPDPWVLWEGSFESAILMWSDLLNTSDPAELSMTGYQPAL